MDKDEIISELHRVAAKLNTTRVTKRQFSEHGQVSVGTVENRFGSWNQGLEAAGLDTSQPGPSPELHQRKFSDDELLKEIIRLTQEMGKKPTLREMNAKGRFSVKPYLKRWGSLEKACQVAYANYGFPSIQSPSTQEADSEVQKPEQSPRSAEAKLVIPKTHMPQAANRRKKVQFGEPIDFRGLRFAPINEQGVVYLFGMVSRELGFLIESIRTDYPDCEGKRCVDSNKQRWEHVLIEFEYRSRNFLDHGHSSEDCDLIVCWIHDWADCPIEVLELKSRIGYLPNR